MQALARSRPHWPGRSASRPRRARLLAGVTALALLLAGPALADRRVALVIGNGAYSGTSELPNPGNDAVDIGAALKDLGFEVYLGVDQTLEAMQLLIDDFGRAAAESDAALFYYAGHAFQVADQNHLVPVDIRLDRPDMVAAQTIQLETVIAAMERSKGVKILMIDACRDNPLGLQAGGGSGLARVGGGADFFISYATQPGAVAYDGEGRNGTFTEAVLGHIATPGQDLAEMMMAIRRDVVARTGGQQVPWENSSLTRQFKMGDGPPGLAPETLFYQVARRAADPELMRLYIDRYPDGAHVPELLAMLSGGNDSGTLVRGVGPASDDEQGEQLWSLAQRTRLPALLRNYLTSYPQGRHAGAAQRLLDDLGEATEPGPQRLCEQLVTHPRDRTETTPGVPYALLAQHATRAMAACSAAIALAPEQPVYVALLARATAAAGLRERAVELYQQAAGQGDLRAMVSLALLKETGDGVAPDPAGAVELYRRAAALGSADAAINLAVALLEGQGMAKDTVAGMALLRQASQGGSAIATFNLGVLAQEGRQGRPEDALALFERAAREGETRAWRAAAVLLDEGRGTARDPDQAAVRLLLGVASDSGDLLRELVETPQNWAEATRAALVRRLALAGITADPGALEAGLRLWRNGGFSNQALG